MPALIDTHGRAAPLRKAKVVKAKRRTPRAPTAAERVTTRSRARTRSIRDEVERQHTAAIPATPRRQRSMTPDTADRNRSRTQQAKDAAGVAKSIRDSRARAEAKRGRPYAGPRGMSVERYKGKNTREALAALTRPAPKKHSMLVAGARGQTRPTHKMGATGGEMLATALRNAPSDAAELVVTMPTSIAHQAKTLVTDPKKFAKEQVEPYIRIAKDPTKEFAERPVSTTLSVLPIGRGLTRGTGAAARKTGKQTLARPDATLPGTALKEKSTGSRDALVRHQQGRKDKEDPTPHVKARDVKRRVDEHHDFAQLKVQEAADKAAKHSKAHGHDADTAKAHVEAAREQAKGEMDVEFARQFGANQRPAVGAAEKRATKVDKDQAEAREKGAKRKVKLTRKAVKTREAEAKEARGGSTERLTALEAERAAAQRALAEHQGAHTKARIEKAEAHGSARVSAAKPKTTSKSRELRSERRRTARGVTREGSDARVVVTDENRADAPPTIVDLTHHLPEVGKPGISREKAVDRTTFEATGKKLPRSDVGLFVMRGEDGRVVGALESFAPHLKTDAEGNPVERNGRPVWAVRENSVVVDPAHQRQGIASKLYAAAEKENIDARNPSHSTYTDEGAALVNAMRKPKPVRTAAAQAVEDARAAVSRADRQLRNAERKGAPNLPEIVAARASARTAENQVAALERQLAREEQRASRLEGVTEGRHAAGRMTAGAGRATANQAEKIGHIKDALRAARKQADAANGHLRAIEGEAVHGARQASRAARANLRAAEAGARASTRTAVAGVDQRIGAEQRRVAGVAPKEADRLHAALAGLDDSAAAVRAGRQRVRAADQRIGAERSRTRGVPPEEMNRLVNAMYDADDAQAARTHAGAEHDAAKARHISTKNAAATAPLVAGAKQGRVFADKADANKVAQRLNDAGHEIEHGGKSPVRFGDAGSPTTLRKTKDVSVPVDFVVRKVGDGFAVVPKLAAERMYRSKREGAPLSHASVGTSPATGAKLLRTSRRAFTRAVLPLSPKWLFGQGAEAGLRSLIAGAGPLDIMRFNKVVKEMNAKQEGSGDDLRMRVSGGQFGLTGSAREFAEGKSLAEEFAGTGLEQPARALTRAGATPPMRAVRWGWNKYTSAVLGSINGFFEQNARKAMAGQAIKQGVFNEKRFNALSDKAIADAAHGLKGTEAQVALARQVDRMYGQYQKFSPEVRSGLLHWTPFLPWYLNSIKFLTTVLPADHPYITSMMAAASTTTEDWRKEHGLSLKGDKHRPDFLMGGYPFGGDEKISRLAQFTPFGVASDLPGAVGSLALPQVLGPIFNAAGVDWTGKPLRDEDYKKFGPMEKSIRAAMSALEAQVPGVAQAGRISGLTKRYIDKKDPKEIEPFTTRLKRELPLIPVGASDSSGKKKKPVKVKKRTDAIGFGGDGGGGGGLGL